MRALVFRLAAAALWVPLLGLSCRTEAASATQAWVQRYNGTAASYDVPYAIACDAAGGVVIALYTDDNFAGGDMLVIKYSNAGVPLYGQSVTDAASANGLAIDNGGNVYVTGVCVSDRIAAGLPDARLFQRRHAALDKPLQRAGQQL